MVCVESLIPAENWPRALFTRDSVQDMGAEDKLFATLDTRTRSVDLAPGRKAVLVDTVGFIQQLPQQLVNAFRATLEESLQADVLVRCPVVRFFNATRQHI